MQCLLGLNKIEFRLSIRSHELATLRLANSRAGRWRSLDRDRDCRAPCGRRRRLDVSVLGLCPGGCGLQNSISREPEHRSQEVLTAVTVTMTFVVPVHKVSVVVVVTSLSTSSVIQTVVAGAVDMEVEVAHKLVFSSVRVTVALSRPRFSITWASARRTSRAARNAARLSAATCLVASRRRRAPPVMVVAVVDGEPVSRAAAYTTVGVILAHGSW